MVFVLRAVEGLDVRETAECLDINAATVRTRLFRAQRLLRGELSRRLQSESTEIFDFGAERCDRVVAYVLARLPALIVAMRSLNSRSTQLPRAGSLHPPHMVDVWSIDRCSAASLLGRQLLERDHRRTLDGFEHDGRGHVAHAGDAQQAAHGEVRQAPRCRAR